MSETRTQDRRVVRSALRTLAVPPCLAATTNGLRNSPHGGPFPLAWMMNCEVNA